jgi:hypothetical protein
MEGEGFSFRCFLSGGRFAADGFPGFSYTGAGRRCEHIWLACCGTGMHSANGAESRRVAQQIVKEFRAHARPQPSQDTPACPTSTSNCKAAAFPRSNARSAKRGCEGWLRSRSGAKLISTGRRRRELICPAAKGCTDLDQAGRLCAKRQPVRVYEPGRLFGTGRYKDRNPRDKCMGIRRIPAARNRRIYRAGEIFCVLRSSALRLRLEESRARTRAQK